MINLIGFQAHVSYTDIHLMSVNAMQRNETRGLQKKNVRRHVINVSHRRCGDEGPITSRHLTEAVRDCVVHV